MSKKQCMSCEKIVEYSSNKEGEIEYITIIEHDEDGIYDVKIEGLGQMEEPERRVITLPKGREVTIDTKFFIDFKPKVKSYVRAECVQIYFSTSKFVYGPIICNIKTNRKGIFKIDWNAKSYPPRHAKK